MHAVLLIAAVLSPLVGAHQEVARETSPVLIYEAKPNYTADARRAEIEGIVEMDAVVLEDGTVGDVVVTKSLDQKYGLDDEALKAMKKWRFKPATKDGKAVTVHVFVEMAFKLPKEK
jgi:TonB family protein